MISVELLLDQNRSVKAAYGYNAYGASNLSLTKTAAGFSPNVNAYKFQSERFDTGSNTLDFGARHYSPGLERFVQRDSFQSALDDLGLSTNPLDGNRYVLTGANPINFVDLDGHMTRAGNGGGGGSGRGGGSWMAAAAACVVSVRCGPATGTRWSPFSAVFLVGLNLGMQVGRGQPAAPQHTESIGPTVTQPAPTPAPPSIHKTPAKRANSPSSVVTTGKPGAGPTVHATPKATPQSVVVLAKKDALKKAGATAGIAVSGLAGMPGIPHALDQLLNKSKDLAGQVAKDRAQRIQETAPKNRAERRDQQKKGKAK